MKAIPKDKTFSSPDYYQVQLTAIPSKGLQGIAYLVELNRFTAANLT
jgi:hypothetical protein